MDISKTFFFKEDKHLWEIKILMRYIGQYLDNTNMPNVHWLSLGGITAPKKNPKFSSLLFENFRPDNILQKFRNARGRRYPLTSYFCQNIVLVLIKPKPIQKLVLKITFKMIDVCGPPQDTELQMAGVTSMSNTEQ